MNIFYCIDCEQVVNQKVHYGVWEGEVVWDWCEGEMLCSCPPPNLDEFWYEHAQEPTDEELEIIERNAEWMVS